MVAASFVRQPPIELSIQVAHRDPARDQHRAIVLRLDAGGLDVPLVRDLADDLLDDVLERDEAAEIAVLVHHEGQVLALLPECQQLLAQRRGLGNEPGSAAQRHQIDPAQLRPVRVQRLEQVDAVQHADDAVGIAAPHGKSRISAGDDLGQNAGRRQIGVDRFDAPAMGHHVAHLESRRDRGRRPACRAPASPRRPPRRAVRSPRARRRSRPTAGRVARPRRTCPGHGRSGTGWPG